MTLTLDQAERACSAPLFVRWHFFSHWTRIYRLSLLGQQALCWGLELEATAEWTTVSALRVFATNETTQKTPREPARTARNIPMGG